MGMMVSNLRAKLARQIEMYQELLAIVREQLAAAGESSSGPSGTMETSLARRQNIMSQIESAQAETKAIEDEIAHNYRLAEFNLHSLSAHLTVDEYDPLAKSYARLGWVLSEIVAVDIDLEEAMRKRLDDLAAPVSKPAPIGKLAIDAYKAQKK